MCTTLPGFTGGVDPPTSIACSGVARGRIRDNLSVKGPRIVKAKRAGEKKPQRAAPHGIESRLASKEPSTCVDRLEAILT